MTSISEIHLAKPNSELSNGISSSTQHRSRFTFQQHWFEYVRLEWEELTMSLRAKKLHILEVGAFEGASTTWILDNLMSHPESTMTVIDTFQGGMEHQDKFGHEDKYELASLEDRFRSNVSKCEHVQKLQVIKANSDQALLDLRRQSAMFDFIYIDASHVAIDVLHDAVVSWRILNVHGTMVFDDVSWKGYMEDCYNPRVAIMSFLQCAAQEVESKETESQMWVRKVPIHISATPNPDPDLYYWGEGLCKKEETTMTRHSFA